MLFMLKLKNDFWICLISRDKSQCLLTMNTLYTHDGKIIPSGVWHSLGSAVIGIYRRSHFCEKKDLKSISWKKYRTWSSESNDEDPIEEGSMKSFREMRYFLRNYVRS